ncbi:MAG: hypothetical protein CMC76_11310 [Flavobacteriaceae bacterium]|nr:hypothetical protein [Flavobacteriaceae bacterium]
MKKVIIIASMLLITSCIPVKVAPKFKNVDYKVMQGRKFQKKMPREMAFIFKDPKDEKEFYNYINKKYKLNDQNVGYNVPFEFEGKILYLSYYEAERTDETLNLPLVIADAKRDGNGNSRLFEGNYTSRKGHWYILVTVYDEDIKNCLKDNHPLKEKVLLYLKNLREEYITTQNYEELLLTENPNSFTN